MQKNILRTIKTTVLICDEPYPHSGNIYPKAVIEKALTDKVLQQQLVTHTLFGDLENKKNFCGQCVNMAEVAFSVKRLYWYRNELRADIDILNTPNGRILRQIYKAVGPNKRQFTLVGYGNIGADKICTQYQIAKLTYIGKR